MSPQKFLKNDFWGGGLGTKKKQRRELSGFVWGNHIFKCYFVAYPKEKIGAVFFMNGQNGLSIMSDLLQTSVGGEQPALRWIKYDHYDSPSMQFAKAAREKGATAAINEFHPALLRGDISEDSINNVGYQLMSAHKPHDALQVFELNGQLPPDSWNT